VLFYRSVRGPPGTVTLHSTVLRTSMARSCAICGKVSMGGFNPQSSGMNRVRAHRRMKPNLQPFVVDVKGTPTRSLVCTRCRRTQLKSAK